MSLFFLAEKKKVAGAASTGLSRSTWKNRPGARVPPGKCVRDAADPSLQRSPPPLHDCGSLAPGFLLRLNTAPSMGKANKESSVRAVRVGDMWRQLVNKSFSVTQCFTVLPSAWNILSAELPAQTLSSSSSSEGVSSASLRIST